MLYMDYKVPVERLLLSPGGEFEMLCKKEWFEDSNVIKIAEGIDSVKHITEDIFESPITGKFIAKNLSGGAKTVILCYLGIYTEYVYPLSWLGENCFEYLKYIPESVDITFAGDFIPDLDNLGTTFISKKTGKKLYDIIDYVFEVCQYAF